MSGALGVEHVTMPVFGRLDPHASRADQIAHIAEAARQIRIQDLKLVHYANAIASPAIVVIGSVVGLRRQVLTGLVGWQ